MALPRAPHGDPTVLVVGCTRIPVRRSEPQQTAGGHSRVRNAAVGMTDVAVPGRRRLVAEVVIVLALSLGASAIYSIVQLIDLLTRVKPLGDQVATINPPLSDRSGSDLTYQLLGIIFALAPVALDDYFIARKLYPNVDFYSGIILKAMGIPTSMFTVLFAVARTVGWISQCKEMMEDPSQRIGRPRQIYTGAVQRDFVPLSERG